MKTTKINPYLPSRPIGPPAASVFFRYIDGNREYLRRCFRLTIFAYKLDRFYRPTFTMGLLTAYFLSFSAVAEPYRYINLDSFRISYEGTFQNQDFLTEPTHLIPPSEKKLNWRVRLAKSYAKTAGSIPVVGQISDLRWSSLNDITKENGKSPYVVRLANGLNATVTAEPKCLEWNFSPMHLSKLKSAWEPVFRAADKIGLTPSVYWAGGDSGGGHFHFGATSPELNPLAKHLRLLPNLLAFFHNHPSVLHGFSIPYDVSPTNFSGKFEGFNSGTYHGQRQQIFQETIQEIHRRIKVNAKGETYYEHGAFGPTQNPLFGLKEILFYFGKQSLYIHHFAALNLENLYNYFLNGDESKFTLEIRPIRPLPTAAHVEAVARFLTHLIDYLANPNLELEPKVFSPQEVLFLPTPLVVEGDWHRVKKLLNYNDPLLNELIFEYTRSPHLEVTPSGPWEFRTTYSEFSKLNLIGEIYRRLRPGEVAPTHTVFNGQQIPIQTVPVGSKMYAVGVWDKSIRPSSFDCTSVLRPSLQAAHSF